MSAKGVKKPNHSNPSGYKFKNIEGNRYFRIRVDSFHGRSKHRGMPLWLCECDCGNVFVDSYSNIIKRKSCGCWLKDNKPRTTHGHSKEKIYKVWKVMIQRCELKTSASYPKYGGQGISVCDDWHKFENFYKWVVNNGYKDGLTIDRIDNYSGYGPNNCRLITRQEQAWNKRKTIYIVENGTKIKLIDYCTKHGLLYDTCYQRYKRGLNPFYERKQNL